MTITVFTLKPDVTFSDNEGAQDLSTLEITRKDSLDFSPLAGDFIDFEARPGQLYKVSEIVKMSPSDMVIAFVHETSEPGTNIKRV